MTLLEHYLHAVSIYLPRGVPSDDIISELSESLQGKLEEGQAALGRPLTEAEQADLLARHGNPLTVAAAYGPTNRGLAFGWQLISPEGFPPYVAALLLNFTVIVVTHTLWTLFGVTTLGLVLRDVLIAMLVASVLTTVVFIGLDAFRRRERISPREQSQFLFLPLHLKRVPRGWSAAGMVVLTATGLWWAAVPFQPALMLGGAANSLRLTQAWAPFYWPILVLLAAGVIQRGVTLARPEWNWLQAVTRLTTNGLALAMLYPFLVASPYVAVAGTAVDVAGAEALALQINTQIWWQVLLIGGIYWLFWSGFFAWVCAQHLRHLLRHRREQAA
jgi:hypothetical protein